MAAPAELPRCGPPHGLKPTPWREAHLCHPPRLPSSCRPPPALGSVPGLYLRHCHTPNCFPSGNMSGSINFTRAFLCNAPGLNIYVGKKHVIGSSRSEIMKLRCVEQGEGEAGGLQEQKGEGPKRVAVCGHGRLVLVLLIPHLSAGGAQPHRWELCSAGGGAELSHRRSLRAHQHRAGVIVTRATLA